MKKSTFFILTLFSLIFTSCIGVDPGHRGVEIKYGGHTNMEKVYNEGLSTGIHWIIDDMVEYDCREQTMTIHEKFLDYDGLDTDIEIILYYAPQPDKVNYLHTKIGQDFRDTKLKGIFKGAVKTVIPKHQALKLNREERNDAEEGIAKILKEELPSMYIDFRRVQITDVGLPPKISEMIVLTKEQEERNKLAAKKELEATNNANAEIARAKGEYTAATYDAKTKEILSQPALLKLKELDIEMEYAKKGVSRYGNNNVFGSGSGIGILKMNK